MADNRKKLMLPAAMAQAGWDLARSRDDIETLRFEDTTPPAAFQAMLATADGIALWGRPFPAADIALAPELKVVARIGVGYDAVDVPALTRRGIPLLIAGTANSVTVAEHAIYFMMELAKQGAAMHALVQDGRWTQKFSVRIFDLYGKTVLIVGFGKIGTRVAARCLAMEMNVLVHDPYVPEDVIRSRGCTPAPDLDAALPKADFVTIHCPKSPATVGMFNADRLARMKRSAFLVNTARGGIIDEAALHAALTSGDIAGAGLDVFAQEPIVPENTLPHLPNVITAPHMAGVTQESLDRMAVASVRNILGVFDGRVERDNVVNKEVLG
ncbi:hydroxyacid dehydrogenase [Limobrevibacterium gyesilva]|uniref:Hydroxyacid dehydrogenase n=1 Tax=Limobrevibacterium gyesilva TaxID=2991712 RepID=A0AA41YM42_9PROT|nr:hydroxyacid dehydrogenase [Limobrevibacterium gyesilva]MCW3474478.1 hydroxyacid dehydrogenase [Limobrevibacterium gyesilva]